jgi:hypothetical protein
MIGRLRIAAVAGLLCSLAAPLLAQQLPPAMDRVPADAQLVTTIRNLEQFHTSIESLARQIGVDAEALDQLGTGRQILQTPGLDPQGSAAMAIYSTREGSQNFVAVLPVRDYRAFITGIGGQGDGIDEVDIHDQTFFVKDIGNGFAAAAPTRELVERFEGRPGNAAAHQQALGATGHAVIQDAGFFIVANIPALEPSIRQAVQQMAAQAQMMAAMMGGGGVDFQRVQEASDAFLRDATASIIGFRSGERGVRLDFGTQFREGSELAGYFDAQGDSGQIINSLPSNPYLLAFALDLRSPGVRQVLQQLAGAAGQDQQFQALNPLQALEMADGAGFLMGTSPAAFSGLFLNTVAYMRTRDPQAYMQWVRNAFTAMHGQKVEGITYRTSLEEQRVGERDAHTWSLRMQADQRHPGAQQAMQMQMVLFGPAGLSGYMATTQQGVVMTYSRNAGLLDQAVTAAETDAGLRQDPGIRAVSEQLPSGRTFEAYIGIRNILETALGMAAMFGAGPMDFELPEELPPVGIGGTTSGGGLRITLFVPAEVLATAQQLRESMEDEDDWDDDDDVPTGLPRF